MFAGGKQGELRGGGGHGVQAGARAGRCSPCHKKVNRGVNIYDEIYTALG